MNEVSSSFESDCKHLKNSQLLLEEGLMLYKQEDKEHIKGRMLFWLGELEIDIEYITENNTTLIRLNENEVKLIGHVPHSTQKKVYMVESQKILIPPQPQDMEPQPTGFKKFFRQWYSNNTLSSSSSSSSSSSISSSLSSSPLSSPEIELSTNDSNVNKSHENNSSDTLDNISSTQITSSSLSSSSSSSSSSITLIEKEQKQKKNILTNNLFWNNKQENNNNNNNNNNGYDEYDEIQNLLDSAFTTASSPVLEDKRHREMKSFGQRPPPGTVKMIGRSSTSKPSLSSSSSTT